MLLFQVLIVCLYVNIHTYIYIYITLHLDRQMAGMLACSSDAISIRSPLGFLLQLAALLAAPWFFTVWLAAAGGYLWCALSHLLSHFVCIVSFAVSFVCIVSFAVSFCDKKGFRCAFCLARDRLSPTPSPARARRGRSHSRRRRRHRSPSPPPRDRPGRNDRWNAEERDERGRVLGETLLEQAVEAERSRGSQPPRPRPQRALRGSLASSGGDAAGPLTVAPSNAAVFLKQASQRSEESRRKVQRTTPREERWTWTPKYEPQNPLSRGVCALVLIGLVFWVPCACVCSCVGAVCLMCLIMQCVCRSVSSDKLQLRHRLWARCPISDCDKVFKGDDADTMQGAYEQHWPTKHKDIGPLSVIEDYLLEFYEYCVEKEDWVLIQAPHTPSNSDADLPPEPAAARAEVGEPPSSSTTQATIRLIGRPTQVEERKTLRPKSRWKDGARRPVGTAEAAPVGTAEAPNAATEAVVHASELEIHELMRQDCNICLINQIALLQHCTSHVASLSHLWVLHVTCCLICVPRVHLSHLCPILCYKRHIRLISRICCTLVSLVSLATCCLICAART